MANIAQSFWEFPLANAVVNVNTPPQSTTRHNVYLAPGNNETPLSVFLRCHERSTDMVTQRFLQAGMNVVWGDARVLVEMRYRHGIHSLYTNYFSYQHAVDQFIRIMEDKHSFDIEQFRQSPLIIVKISYMFNRTIIPPQPPPRNRRGPQVQRVPATVMTRAMIRENLGPAARTRSTRNARVFNYGYDHYKKKMYHRRSIDSFYHMTDAILEVPSTRDGLCFPMAFIKSQLRVLFLQSDEVYETKSSATTIQFETNGSIDWMSNDELFDPYNCPLLNEHGKPDSDFHRHIDGGLFYPFNPFKSLKRIHNDGFEELYSDTTEEYNIDWYLAARDMHDQVESYFGRPINYTDEEQVCTAYSKFFKCHIHMYSLVGRGHRYMTYVEPSCIQYKRHVHILVEENHCIAITNVRRFMQKSSGSGQMSKHNYCDICTYTTTSSINKEKMMKHVRNCEENNRHYNNHTYSQYDKTVSRDLRSRNLFFREGTNHCTVCNSPHTALCKHIGHRFIVQYVTKCTLCKEEVQPFHEGMHLCYITTPKIKDKLDDNSLWVYDIEASMNFIGDTLQHTNQENLPQIYQHTCILVCMKQVYTGLQMTFKNLHDFCHELETNPIFDDANILAHNGGGYDHQYILQYCEEHSIEHTIIPHASGKHKFISLTMIPYIGKPRRFIDFMAYVPGSLKQIGKDFGLGISKGDFPHNFSRAPNEQYRGSMPSLHTDEDFYGYKSKRSVKDQRELEQWHVTESSKYCQCVLSVCIPESTICQTCNTELWSYQIELEKYCWLDVEVLSQVVKLYREQSLQSAEEEDCIYNWNYKGLDPFTLLTQSQIAITVFLNGIQEPIQIASTQYSLREGYNEKSNLWLRHKEEREGLSIMYKGNSLKEWYHFPTDSFYPGYCQEINKVYIFYDCYYEGCTLCYQFEGKHPTRYQSIEDITLLRDEKYCSLRKHYSVEIIWEHEYDHYSANEVDREMRVMYDRQFFSGGRTEVFQAYAKSCPEYKLKYLDVCSLYPECCAKKMMPISHPLIYYGNKVDKTRLHFQHYNRYYGFAYCLIQPRGDDILGLLPSKDPISGRLQFTVREQWGCWHTEEIYVAQEAGYIIKDVIQVYHWDENMRSDTLFRGYVSYWLKIKQQAEGWLKLGATSANPTIEEKERIRDELYAKNGYIAKIDINKVSVNPVLRGMAKLKLNSIWGKFVQQKQDDYFTYINGYNQYMQLVNHKDVNIEKLRFRHIKENFFKVTYKKRIGYEMSNNKYNIFIGASVTAHARCILHRKMLIIGPDRIIYCDTDSIISKVRRDEDVPRGSGLGSWVDEYPDIEITTFYGLAPKSYNLIFEDGKSCLKTKGINLTIENQEKVDEEVLGEMLEGEFFMDREKSKGIQLKNMNIMTNSRYAQLPYATLLTLYNEKVMRPVLTKRKLIRYFGPTQGLKLNRDFTSMRLVPIGFCPDGNVDDDNVDERRLSALYYT